MFNQSGFQQQHFNRSTISEIYLTANLSAQGRMVAKFTRNSFTKSLMSARSEIRAVFVTVIPVKSSMSSQSSMTAKMLRLIKIDARMSATSSLNSKLFRLVSYKSQLSSQGRVAKADTNVLWAGTAYINARSSLGAKLLRRMSYAADFSTQTGFRATMLRRIPYGSQLSAQGGICADARRYKLRRLLVSGQFKPGDELVIESRYIRARLNGQPARYMIDGDWPELLPGVNEITYIDNASVRIIDMRVTSQSREV